GLPGATRGRDVERQGGLPEEPPGREDVRDLEPVRHAGRRDARRPLPGEGDRHGERQAVHTWPGPAAVGLRLERHEVAARGARELQPADGIDPPNGVARPEQSAQSQRLYRKNPSIPSPSATMNPRIVQNAAAVSKPGKCTFMPK